MDYRNSIRSGTKIRARWIGSWTLRLWFTSWLATKHSHGNFITAAVSFVFHLHSCLRQFTLHRKYFACLFVFRKTRLGRRSAFLFINYYRPPRSWTQWSHYEWAHVTTLYRASATTLMRFSRGNREASWLLRSSGISSVCYDPAPLAHLSLSPFQLEGVNIYASNRRAFTMIYRASIHSSAILGPCLRKTLLIENFFSLSRVMRYDGGSFITMEFIVVCAHLVLRWKAENLSLYMSWLNNVLSLGMELKLMAQNEVCLLFFSFYLRHTRSRGWSRKIRSFNIHCLTQTT